MSDAMTHKHRIAFSFPAVPASISDVRHLIITEARTLPFSAQDIEDIELAVSEVFTNLVQHSQGYRIRGVCEVNANRLEIRFEVDQSLAAHLHRTTLPVATALGGRGIPLLHMLIPIVELSHRGNSHAELRLVKPVSEKGGNGREAHSGR